MRRARSAPPVCSPSGDRDEQAGTLGPLGTDRPDLFPRSRSAVRFRTHGGARGPVVLRAIRIGHRYRVDTFHARHERGPELMGRGGVELLHATPGRIRLRIPEVKSNPALAREIQKQISGYEGVRRVEANPITGSILVLYDLEAASSVVELARLFVPELGLDESALGFAPVSSAGDADAGACTEPSASMAEDIARYFRNLNEDVAAATGGPDLKVLLPVTLFV